MPEHDFDPSHHLHALHLQVHAAMQQAHEHLEHHEQEFAEAGSIDLTESLHAVHHHLKQAHLELEKHSEPHEHAHHEAH